MGILKKLKLVACSRGDSSVGIPSHCEMIDVGIKSNEVILHPVKNSPYGKNFWVDEPITLRINKNLSKLKDNEIVANIYKKTNINIFDGELDSFETEDQYNRRLDEQAKMDDEIFFDEMSELPYKKQEKLFKEYFNNKSKRDEMWKKFSKYKKQKREKQKRSSWY